MVDRDWVRKIAYLARLKLTPEEEELFSRQLADIISFVKQLEEVNTEGVEPFVQEFKETPMREDEPEESMSREKALMNAPEKAKGFFVVPRIVDV